VSDRAGEPASAPAENAWFDRVYRAVPLATVFVALLAVYAWEASRHTSPWLFTDELELSQISRAIEATGHGARRGEPYFWQTLYTWLIAPAWSFGSTSTAYAVVKYIGVIVMTLTVVPTYFLARTIVSARAALFAAAATAAVPALAYAPMILEEPLSYPYAACAFLAMAYALARRRPIWIVLAVVLCLLGGLVRGELGVLPVVGVLAAGLYAVTSEPGRRWRSRFSTWDWVGAIVLGAGAIIVFSGLVGKFSQSWSIATGHYRGRMLDYGLQAAGSLTIGLGLLPVVAALAALARPRDEERTPELRAFTSLFAAALIGFGIYTAVKASYLSTVFGTTVQERNLIYLVPLVFVGTALWVDRPRLRWIPLAAAVGFVAYLIVATPYQLDNVPAADSLGVAMAQLWNRDLSFAHGGIERGLIVALVVAVVLLVLPRFLGRRPGWILGVTSAAAVLVLAWGLTGQIAAANYSNDASQSLIKVYPRPLTWLDEKTHGRPTLYLGQHLNSGTDLGVWLTEFWNPSLKYVWSVDGSAPGPGPTQTPNTHADGRLYPVPPGGVDYVLAEPGIELDGTIVSRPTKVNRWFLYKVRKPLRYAFNETGIFADGQTGCDRAPCPKAESAYNRFSTPGQKPGYAVVDVSRVNACGAPVPPAGVRVTIGKLIEGRDKQPHIGHVTGVQRWTLRIGSARRFVLPTPKPPFRVEVKISPTYTPLAFGGSDQRLLGGLVGFDFSPTPVKPTVTPPPCS
jgi:hypothetical protein